MEQSILAADTDLGMKQEAPKMDELKRKLEAGQYEVDPSAVADALLARLRELAQAGKQS